MIWKMKIEREIARMMYRVVLKAVIGLISMMVFVVWSSVGWGLGSVIFGGSRVFGGVCGVVIFLKFEFKVLMALYKLFFSLSCMDLVNENNSYLIWVESVDQFY